ncbi:MAG: class I SAM-dependent methyltransferase [Candidatus Eiseniibacteriota bacterium]
MPTPATDPSRHERWEAGDAYEFYVGRWSRRVAAEFVPWLGVPPGARWLDVGCGSGALTETVLRLASPREALGIDPSPGFVAHAGRTVGRARFEIGDARALAAADGSFDAVVSGLVLNFVPRPDRALAEMARVTRAGGVVAFYVWDYAGEMQCMRRFWDAATALDPGALDLDESRRFPICRPEPLERLAREAGLRDVVIRAIDARTRFASFDDYWDPFLGGQGPAPGYAVSLDEERGAALRARLLDRLPIAADGSIDLVARAWAARGTR